MAHRYLKGAFSCCPGEEPEQKNKIHLTVLSMFLKKIPAKATDVIWSFPVYD